MAYADDLLLIIKGQSRTAIVEAATAAMQLVTRWGRRAGVEVSITKTVTMILRAQLSASRPTIIRTKVGSVRVVGDVKYVGVWVTPGMRFERHLLRWVLRKD